MICIAMTEHYPPYRPPRRQTGECKVCASERRKAWYQANRVAVLSRQRARRLADPEAQRARRRAWYAARNPS
jgi:hypothetical protein